MLVMTERVVERGILEVSFRDHIDNEKATNETLKLPPNEWSERCRRDHKRKQNLLGGTCRSPS